MKTKLILLCALPAGLITVAFAPQSEVANRLSAAKSASIPPPVAMPANPVVPAKKEAPAKTASRLLIRGKQRLVTDLLDGLIQPRFAADAGDIFGFDRVYSSINGHKRMFTHSGHIAPEFYSDDANRAILKKINKTHLGYVVSFLHTTHVPGKPKADKDMQDYVRDHPDYLEKQSVFLSPLATYNSRKFPVLTDLKIESEEPYDSDYSMVVDSKSNWRVEEKKRAKIYEKVQKEALNRTKPIVKGWETSAKSAWFAHHKGQNLEVTQGDWRLFLRPVKAGKASCVSCHKGAKVGDTLGVMVYAIRNQQETAH